MFLNTVCRMFSNLYGYLFRIRNRKRVSYPFTDEQFATVAQACPVTFDRPIKEDLSDDDFDLDPPDCPAIIPKGFTSESDGYRTYVFLFACKNCGKHEDHLTEDCKIKSCDSEYFKRRYPGIPPPKESPFERRLLIHY